jgi:hypothetical protein
MDEQRAPTKAELLDDIDGSWQELNAELESLSEPELTDVRDHEGWSVKDHVVHMTAWERSALFFLQGKPRHEGLGVDEAVYRSDEGFDKINDSVYRQHKDLPADEALRQFSDVHEEMLQELYNLSDADLQQPYRHYLPDEAGERDGPRAFEVIQGNTSDHYREHLQWIKDLLGTAPGEALAGTPES